jgi:hypothetical protein
MCSARYTATWKAAPTARPPRYCAVRWERSRALWPRLGSASGAGWGDSSGLRSQDRSKAKAAIVRSWRRPRSLFRSAPAPVSVPLVEATVAGAVGRATATAAARLAANALKTMFVSKLKLVLLCSLAIGSFAGIAFALTRGRVENWAPPRRAQQSRAAAVQADRRPNSETGREVGTVFFRVMDQSTKQPLSVVLQPRRRTNRRIPTRLGHHPPDDHPDKNAA